VEGRSEGGRPRDPGVSPEAALVQEELEDEGGNKIPVCQKGLHADDGHAMMVRSALELVDRERQVQRGK